MNKVREGYKMTESGEIPEEWEVKTSGEIFEFSGGISIPRAKLGNEGISYLHYGDIHKGKRSFIDLSIDKQWLPKLDIENYNINDNIKLETGDVVFADASEDYEGIGKSVVIINRDNIPFVSGLHTIIGKDKIDTLEVGYKRFCFSTESVRKQFRFLSTGTSVYGISRENIKRIKLLVPTIKEQQKISSILSSIDEQIEITDKLIEKTNELKKGLMQRLLTSGIGHERFKYTEIGRIPEDWEVKNAGKVFHTVTDYVANGSFASLKENVNYKDEEDYAVLIRLTDYNNNFEGPFVYVDKKAYDFLNKSSLKPGDIIIANVGAYAGFTFRVKEISKPMTLGPNSILVRSEEHQEYIYYWLQSRFGQESLKKIISTTAQPKFNKTDFKTLLIPIPNLKEQKQIASILSSVDNQIDQYESKKEKLQQLKSGLMQKLLTGKIRVKKYMN